jgi:cytochrome P450
VDAALVAVAPTRSATAAIIAPARIAGARLYSVHYVVSTTTVVTPLPPGPRAPRALQTYLWLTRPTQVFDYCARRYGDPFTLRLFLAGDMVYVADPTAVREMFNGDPRVFHAGDAYSLMEPTGGKNSLFLLDEDEHLRMRKLLLQPLHGERLKRWATVIAEVTEREVRRWPVGRPFQLRPITEAITLDVIMRIVFGIEPERAPELRRLLPGLFHVSLAQAPSFVMPALRRDLGPWSPWGRYVRLRARIDELLYAEIDRRRKDVATAGDGRDDVLSLLLGARYEDGRALSNVELRDQLVTMLLAGHETTASQLAWAFERILRHPDVLRRLLDEIEEGGSEYLDAVIKETLRSRPVAAHIARMLTEEMEIKGYRLPARTVVAIGIYLIHHSPALYPDPRAFRPERFLGDGPPDHYSWIPFGGGVRRCLGVGLATLEMQVVIPTILRLVQLRPSRREPERFDVLGVTLVPSRGGELVVERHLTRAEPSPAAVGAPS